MSMVDTTKVHCFTSATFAYLDRVRVLGETLRKHQPNWVFWLCLSDEEPEGFRFDPASEPFDHVVRIGELGISDLPGWIFEHDVVELCTAVKGKMLCDLLDLGIEKVVYLDPDIALFAPLAEVETLLEKHDIILTPHLVNPHPDAISILQDEIAALKHGIYNLGFLAVANRPEGRRMAAWWRDRLLDFCFDDVPNGLFTDQRWCDHVPALFEHVYVLRDPGYNVASWNLRGRSLVINPDGSITANGALLRFFHFTKVTWVGETMLDQNSGGALAVFELTKWYLGRLTANHANGLPPKWWRFATFADGMAITKADRALYRCSPRLRQVFPDPFAATSSDFYRQGDLEKLRSLHNGDIVYRAST